MVLYGNVWQEEHMLDTQGFVWFYTRLWVGMNLCLLFANLHCWRNVLPICCFRSLHVSGSRALCMLCCQRKKLCVWNVDGFVDLFNECVMSWKPAKFVCSVNVLSVAVLLSVSFSEFPYCVSPKSQLNEPLPPCCSWAQSHLLCCGLN